MAIKFSQFVVKTSSSDLSHIVGYNGVDNIQITPTNFLNSALTGTPGQVLFYDTTGVASSNALFFDMSNKKLGIGTNAPSSTLHVKSTGNGEVNIERASGTLINLQAQAALGVIGTNSNHDLALKTNSNVGIRLTTGGNVGIGTVNPAEKLQVDGNIKVGDSQQFLAGTSSDLQIFHNGSDSFIDNYAGNLTIRNRTDDGDVLFVSDDGSGGVATYFFLDGSATQTTFQLDARYNDSVKAKFGNSNDLQIYHEGTDSIIQNYTGSIYIDNNADDQDIIFRCDDGSGGLATYFRVDGSATLINVSAPNGMQFNDNIRIKVGSGSGGDLRLFHNANDSIIQNTTGDLYIENTADNKDIIFLTDNGSGGTVPYMTVDGANEVTSFQKSTKHEDSVVANFGNASDLQIYHDGSNSYVQSSGTGDLIVEQRNDDKDIVFNCDDGSGGITTYLRLDGSSEKIVYSRNQLLTDGVRAIFGSSDDLHVFHNASDSYIENNTGSLLLVNYANDKDIKFFSDDGSGGTTEYLRLDGGDVRTIVSKEFRFLDTVEARFGASGDLRVYHDGTTSHITNSTGNLNILNSSNDADILFRCDDGSGGNATYFFLDGSKADGTGNLYTNFPDKSHLTFGAGDDLQIFHDGSNSFINEVGTGDLYVKASNNFFVESSGGASKIIARTGGAVDLYHNGSKKIETTSTGIKVTGVLEYGDNAAAIAGGLTTGDVYRTGDLLKIVH